MRHDPGHASPPRRIRLGLRHCRLYAALVSLDRLYDHLDPETRNWRNMKTPPSFVALSFAGIAALAAACSSGASSSTITSGSVGHFEVGAKYVALGSSYAAGPGIPTQSGGVCTRSSHNYPNMVAAKLKLSLVDVSCSGATTANVLTTSQSTNPPQIDAVTSDTSLVTFTVGGNDIGYTAAAFSCGMRGAACTSDPAQLASSLATLKTSLTTMVSTIRSKAASAKIVLVTYPRLVPPTACTALNFSQEGNQVVGSMGQGLEQVFVEVAKTTHVLLADPYVIGQTHGPCAPPDARWIAGQMVTVGFPYHPTPLGHEEMAALTERALQG
jgi:lysophospholipase L1-like esterase